MQVQWLNTAEAADAVADVVFGAVVAGLLAGVRGAVFGVVVVGAGASKVGGGKTLGRLRNRRGLLVAHCRTTSLPCPTSCPYSPECLEGGRVLKNGLVEAREPRGR
jgi:hypothetical protein